MKWDYTYTYPTMIELFYKMSQSHSINFPYSAKEKIDIQKNEGNPLDKNIWRHPLLLKIEDLG